MCGGTWAAAAVKRRYRHRTNNSFSTKNYGDRIKIRYTLMNLPQYRLGIILQAAILLIAITNISVVVVAQEEISTTSSPTPKITTNNEATNQNQSISPISPSTTLAPFLPVTNAPIVSEAPMTASPTISPSLPPAPLVSFIGWFIFIL